MTLAIFGFFHLRQSPAPRITRTVIAQPTRYFRTTTTTPSESADDKRGLSAPRWALVLIAFLCLALRLWHCQHPLERAADAYRHLYTGLMVQELGWSSLAQPFTAWSPTVAPIAAWAEFPCNYPPLTALLFRIVAGTWQSILIVKLLLTACEALNAWLVYRLTRHALVALAYWCPPLTIWWVSCEAQIEPLRNTLVLVALNGVRAGRPWGWGAWIDAILVRASAIFLAPQILCS